MVTGLQSLIVTTFNRSNCHSVQKGLPKLTPFAISTAQNQNFRRSVPLIIPCPLIRSNLLSLDLYGCPYDAT